MIFDTTFAIDLLRGRKEAVEKAEEFDRQGKAIFTTAVTVFEIWQGIDIKSEEKREKLRNFVENFGILYLDTESAKFGGEVLTELRESGASIDPEDCMIAGIALRNLQTLLTRDSHFSRIRGLKAVGY